MEEDKSLKKHDGLGIEFRIKSQLNNLDLAIPDRILSKDAYAEKWNLKKTIIRQIHKIDRLNTPKEVE